MEKNTETSYACFFSFPDTNGKQSLNALLEKTNRL